LLAGACTHWLALLLVMLLINSLSALQWPAFLSTIAESVRENQRGMAFGVFEFCVGAGVTIGPAVGAILVPLVGRRTLLWSTGLVALVCAILRLVGLKETAHPHIEAEDGAGGYRLDAGLRWFLAAACLFFVVMAFTVHGPFISLHASDVMHLSDRQINALFATGGLCATIFSLIGGKVIDRVGSRRALAVSVLAHTAILMPWALISASLVGLPIFMLSWMFMQMGFIAYETLLSDVTTSRTRGTVVGLFGTVTGLVSAGAPALGAWLREYTGPISPFWAALGFAVVTAALLILVPQGERRSSKIFT
ncbi:MAG: MFS transporter, partial [Chloroflexota bacterium]|nr:MFS transporter [Chloroflexota bacterium]